MASDDGWEWTLPDGPETQRIKSELARLTTERDAAIARIAELEGVVLVRDRAIKVANDSVERVDRILASWHKVFPVDDPVIARRMVEDRAHAERDAEKVMTDEMYRGQRAAQEAQAAATERARVAENERDAAIARAERAERVAVDAACHHGWRGAKPSGSEFIETPCPACGGRLFISSGGHLTCSVIGCRNPGLRGLTCPKDGGAMVEACEGGRDHA